MKNIERIQILEHRLNTHSELLERIISKLEFDNEPKLKQLDQSVFDGLSNELRFAAVDYDGRVYVFDVKPELMNHEWDTPYYNTCQLIDKGYDSSNWKTSLIEREAIELTGNKLCKAMLANGDSYVMCLVSDISEESAKHEGIVRVVCSSGVIYFEDTTEDVWNFAVPINNQGNEITEINL